MGFHWELTKQEVETWNWRGVTEFEKASHNFIVEDGKVLYV